MTAIRKILHPTDFSACADAATELAIEVAQKFDAELIILHVYLTPIYIGAFEDVYALPIEVAQKLQDDAARALDKVCQRASAKGVRAQPLLVTGLCYDSITAVVRSHHADLIVMGTHGRTGLKHLLLGSVAERTLRTADCPVLTVRAPSVDNSKSAAL